MEATAEAVVIPLVVDTCLTTVHPRLAARPPGPHPNLIATGKAILKLLTSTTTALGSDTTPDAMTPASTSIIPGSTAASPAASAGATSGALAEAVPAVSGLAASLSASPPLTLPCAVTGSGTAIRS